ncbi:hypothetical protein D621_01880 [beta proteobacterium AAP51]|nr:hypothetical protein D621_01880 [beta proteobacterium AAP51]
MGDALFTKARLIKDLGNQAVHSTKKVAATDALAATRELFHFGYWLARTYGRGARPEPGLSFKTELLPKPAAPAMPQTAEQLQKLAAQLQEKDQKLADVLASKAALDAELQKLREEVATAKKANSAQPDTHDYSEAETRKAFIDLLLKEAGWTLNPAKNFEVEVVGMPNAENKGFVDYVLWGDDGNQPLTAADLVELERMLVEAGGTKALIDEAKEKSQGLGLFIRSLVGLDREAAMQAFSEFLKGSTATPDQIEFIELVVQELTLNGVMEADRLFQSPFTDLSAQGPLGVFPAASVSTLVDVLQDIRARAVA